MFIIWLPKQSAEQAIWQASENESFDWLKETIGHYKGCFPLKVKSKCRCTMLKKFVRLNYMWVHHVEKVYLVKLRALYVFACQCYTGVFWEMDVVSGLELHASIFLSLVFKKTLQMTKELVKMIRGSYVCRDVFFLSHLLKGSLASCRQNFSNICQLIFIFLTVYCNKIFKHWQESSSLIRLRFSSIFVTTLF